MKNLDRNTRLARLASGASRRKGYALAGAIIFLLLVMIMWLGVSRELMANINIEENFQSQKSYYNGNMRALAWGLTLLQTGYPNGDEYSCKVVLEDNQEYVINFKKTTGHNYEVTARSLVAGQDDDVPSAPDSF